MNFKQKIIENNDNNFNVRDELQNLPLDDILNYQPKNGFAVCALNILGDLNIGTIIRSAVIFGADKFYIAGRKRWDRRSSVGSHNYIDIEYVDAWDDSTETLNYDKILKTVNQNYVTVACETEGLPIKEFPKGKMFKPCFIFGSEGFGIPSNVLDNVNYCVTIPQLGVLRSLNVSSAASIIMYEYVRNF